MGIVFSSNMVGLGSNTGGVIPKTVNCEIEICSTKEKDQRLVGSESE
jgi:hypothetical protein